MREELFMKLVKTLKSTLCDVCVVRQFINNDDRNTYANSI